MMKRFSRKRRNGGEKAKSSIDGAQWLPKLIELGIVEATSLATWTDPEIPPAVAVIGRGDRADGTNLIVAFSPKSATEALLAGLSAAAFAVEKSEFAGQVLVIAPQWESGARRLLGLLGRAPYALEAIAAPALGTGRTGVQAEQGPRVLAANAGQLAARLPSSESQASFRRAALAFEGLAAKHGGTVRIGLDRIELVVLARRVALIRIADGAAVLETQIGGRATTPLAGADLASALDGLEGQIRRRLNDRKVRDGEEGLRGRVIAQLAGGSELRGLSPWPMPGADLDLIDGVGLNAEGDPVVVAVREEIEWTSLAAVLDELGPLSSLLPVLFAEDAPPLRLSSPRLLLAAERFADGIERALGALTLAYELRKVAGAAGADVDLVSAGSGEGAQARAPRRGRRRGGRGRTPAGEENRTAGEPESGPAEDSPDSSGGSSRRRRSPRREASDDESPSEAAADGDDGARTRGRGRGRGRGRRRPPNSGGEEAQSADAEGASSTGGEREDAARADRPAPRSPRFEELSMMDLDEGAPAAGRGNRSSGDSSEDPDEPDDGGSGGRSRRASRRGRRGARGDSRRGGEGRERSDGPLALEDSTGDDQDSSEAVAEEDLVDADDLLEILARLADDAPDLEVGETVEESYEDSEEIDEDDVQSARRRDRDSRRLSRKDEIEAVARAARGRAAILVHGDRDSLLSAVLLARDIRQLEGLWVYPQEELMTFFRSIATDLRDDTPIYVVGFSPSPARDVIQASALYRGRLVWFGRQAWPPEDLVALRESLGADAVHGGEGIDSTLPLVLETCTRRSRFSDKLVDLATGRFTQHDFERWGRLWRWRLKEIAAKSGDIRGDIADLLAGRPSDLAKEAALVELPPVPAEVTWVSEHDFRLVHFGGQIMVVVDVPGDQGLDLQLCARIARERYAATLSLAHHVGEEIFVFAGDEGSGKRALDYLAVTEHLANKLEWVAARSDGDHVARFSVRELARYPERQEEVIGEIAMGRSLLER